MRIESASRIGRKLRHLVTLIEDLNALGIAFVSLGEGIDCATPAGKLQLHILAALAEFETARSRSASGRAWLGRRRKGFDSDGHDLASVAGLPEREAARRLGIPRSTLQRALAEKPPKRAC